MNPIFMTFTKKDLVNFFVVMFVAIIVIPNIVPSSYYHHSANCNFR
jgi:hypothetical protein